MRLRRSVFLAAAALSVAAVAIFGVSSAVAASSVSAPTCTKTAKRSFTCSASFSDIKATSCTIDFGDGSVVDGTLSAGAVKESGTCTASHTYAKKGTFAVSATIYAKDKGFSGPSTTVKAG
jgi:hypothetical protein